MKTRLAISFLRGNTMSTRTLRPLPSFEVLYEQSLETQETLKAENRLLRAQNADLKKKIKHIKENAS